MKIIIRRLLAMTASGLALPGIAQSAEQYTFDIERRDVGPRTVQLEEVVVTGTHIRGAAPTANITMAIDRDEIQRTGYTRVEDLVQSLPQNFAELTPAGRLATEGGSNLSRLNDDQASSFNLRGLGAQSTLTLIDGMRIAGSVGGRVVDISMVPLAMIESVDVLTGGHSAVYGADAVGGVANLLTRRDFKGAQTQVSYGGASEGGERMQVSQLAGMRFEDGGFAVGYDYSKEQPLDLADVGLLTQQPNPVVGDTTLNRNVQSDVRRHSGFVSGQLKPTDRLTLFGHGLYSDKRYVDEERELLPAATVANINRIEHPGTLYAATTGGTFEVTPTWTLRVTASTSATDMEYDAAVIPVGAAAPRHTFLRQDTAAVTSVTAVGDGELFRIGKHAIQMAIGTEQRSEDFRRSDSATGIAFAPSTTDADRTVQSLFAELMLPVLRDGTAAFGHRLELSAAGRYDDYSDFGDTFNPQFGLLWQPIPAISVRGGYAKAFRAPALAERTGSSGGSIRFVSDPLSSTGSAPLVIWRGDNPDLGPEKARSWTLGLEFRPEFAPDTSIALAYYDVEYKERIELPAPAGVDQRAALTREFLYPGLIRRNVDAAALQSIFDSMTSFANLTGIPFGACPSSGACAPNAQSLLAVMPTVAVFDDRTNNIAVDKVNGLDFILKGVMRTRAGEFIYGLNATYTLDHTRNVTVTSPAFDLINEVGKPTDLRGRATLGWTTRALGVFTYVNYVDEYSNPFSVPATSMPSWTTVDVSARIDGSQLSETGFLHGLVATLSVGNVLGREPPRYENSVVGVLYDAANANPFGRYLSLRLQKQW